MTAPTPDPPPPAAPTPDPPLPPPQGRPRRRRFKKRWLIPLGLLALILLALLVAYIRGTWADTVAQNPSSSAQGVIIQLYRNPEGQKQIRCALILDQSPDQVWAVVTDYANHDKIHRYVSKIEVTPKDNGSFHLLGVAHSSLWGDWPYEVHVFHEEAPELGTYRSWWDEPSGPITLNRGAWSLQPVEGGKTLLIYTLEIEVGGYPTWLIRNLVLDRVGKVVGDVRDSVNQRYPRP
jgi:hypothetical protein